MKAAISRPRRRGFTLAGSLAGSFLVACVLALGGCGSTKVYTADKTIVYRGSLYNMGHVQRISSRIDGQLADETIVDMTALDKKGVEGLLKDNGEVTVSMLIEMDAQEIVYLRSPVNKYSEFSKMKSRFEGAQKDITKFMGDKKKTQLKLK